MKLFSFVRLWAVFLSVLFNEKEYLKKYYPCESSEVNIHLIGQFTLVLAYIQKFQQLFNQIKVSTTTTIDIYNPLWIPEEINKSA